MYLIRKQIFAILFTAALFSFSLVNFAQAYPTLKETVSAHFDGGEGDAKQLVAEIDAQMTETLLGRMGFIETYSYAQRLMDKREFGNFSFIKDENGFLHYSSFYRERDDDVFQYALRLKRLQDYVEPYGTKVMFVTAPSKYIPGQTPLRAGLSANDPTVLTQETLFYMNRLQIETLDLGDYLPGGTLDYEQTYFKTDHHWTIPAAFEATRVLLDAFRERFQLDLDPDGYYGNPDNYEWVTYRGGMLGSMGRRTGANFAGTEDFTALWPRFERHYIRESLNTGGEVITRKGRTEKTLILPEVLLRAQNIYQDAQYSMYLNGVQPYDKIISLDCPDGPTILMIRDSYFSPVITFLAPMCSRIDAIWSLEESDEIDIEQYVRDNRFDYIIVEVYPYNIGESAFPFFTEEAEETPETHAPNES